MGAGAGPLHRPQISENSPLPSTTRYPYEYVNKMIFSLRKRRFQKKKVLEFSTHFFSYSVFSSHEKMGVGRGGAQKGRKKNFYPLALPQTNVETHVRFVLGNILKY